MRINRQNLKWAVRMALILLLVGVAEIVVVLFVSKPLPERRSSLEPVLRVSKNPSPTQGKSDSSGRY
jgi:hypothetical protein